MKFLHRLIFKITTPLRSFIPEHIGNTAVLRFLEFLRFIGCSKKNRFHQQFSENRTQYTEHSGMLEDQHRYRDLKFGRRDIARCGCEIIAVYNALHDLDRLNGKTFPEIISAFVKDGMLLGGRFGVSPLAVRSFLTHSGIHTTITANESQFCHLAEKSHGVIFTFYNDRRDILAQIHTVYISRSPKGWVIHNLHGNGKKNGPYASFEELLVKINSGRAKGLCLIGINGVTGDGSH